MNKLYPLTQEEQDYAEKNFWLIPDFLSYHHLPEDEFYDVVVFGFLAAVQHQCRSPCAPDRQNFSALARKNMRWAVYKDYQNKHREKRMADLNAISLETPLAGDEEFTFHDILAAETVNPETVVEEHDSLDRILSVGSEREQAVMRLIAQGYTCPQISVILGLTVQQIWRSNGNIRVKAKAAKAGLEITSAVAMYSRCYYERHHAEILAKERERWNRRKDRRNAQRRGQ